MNDELLTLTDTRGRAAGTALQRAAMVHAWNAPAPKRPTVWLRPALVMAAVIAVIAGLVWVSGRQADPADQRDPADLRYVIGELPEGWRIEQAQEADAGLRLSDEFNIRMALFGTPGQPTAPALQLYWQDPSVDIGVTVGGLMGLADGANLREVGDAPNTAACADLFGTTRCVMNTSFGQINLTSYGLDDADLARPLADLRIVDGEISVEPAALPDGMVVIYQGGWDDQRSLLWAPMKGPGASWVSYSYSVSDRGIVLMTGWQADNDLVGASLTWGDLQPTTVNGRPAYSGFSPLMDSTVLFWNDGTRAFALVNSGTTVDLVAMAASVRPAAGDEWSSVVVDPSSGSDDSTPAEGTYAATPETTVLGEAPPGTDPPVTLPAAGEVRDVAVTQTVQQITEVDASYSCELPSGSYGGVQIAVVAGLVFAREPSGNGSFEWRVDGPAFTEATPYSVDANAGVIAISTEPSATQLRVTRASGDRYVLDLVSVANHPEVKVGVIVLPPASFVTYDVVDAEGNVLTSYESP